jgi:arylsulfatase A-like enzyme
VRLGLRLAVLLSLGLAVCCGPEGNLLNVVIIAIDTLRPDHLGCYGYERATSPNIDDLAASGTLFENAVSQAPWTLPSFGTVFTSLYPTQHGATTVGTRMRTSFPTLASILREEGFSAGAIVNTPVLRPEFGLDRGFEHYDIMSPGVERRAEEVTADALEWIDRRKKAPFFLFVHYFDPHLSYSPPAPYDTLFDPDYMGPVGRSFDLDYFSSQDIPGMRREIGSLSAADINHITALYDGEIAFTDRAIGMLLDGLKQRGLTERTLIVLLSDHGEEFLDHGGLDHGHSLYGELTRVPLVFSLPAVINPGARIKQYVRLLDVTPTILDIVGIRSYGDLEGLSCKPVLTGRGVALTKQSQLLQPGVCYSEALRRINTTKSVVVPPWKLIYDTESGDKMFFNLDEDPGEKQDLQRRNPRELLIAEQMLYRCSLAMSDTWYVQVAAGAATHAFDVTISPYRDLGPGGIRVCEFLDRDGRSIRADSIPEIRVVGNELRIRGLSLTGELTVAFQTEWNLTPLVFDLKIDGLAAAEQTYLGQALTRPDTVPFRMRPGRNKVRADKVPVRKPSPPCFLIWQTESRYKADARARIAESTRKELRSLGYIQ